MSSQSTPPGQVFTPDPLADRLWALACDAVGPTDRPLRVVEPTAGDGALWRAVRRSGVPVEGWLVELDPALVRPLRDLAGPGTTVTHADALTLSRGSAPASELGASFGATAPAALGPTPLLDTGWADVVLANPPYLRETGNAELMRAIRAWNSGALAPLYRKDTDLHVFFWEVAMRWLRPGGVLAFLTPAYWLDSEACAPLRDALLDAGRVLAIWRARDAAAFPGVGVEAAITLWRKGAEAGTTDILDDDFAPARSLTLARDSPWWLTHTHELESLGRARRRLGELYRIVEGVSTGANRLRERDAHRVPDGRVGEGIFVLSSDEADRLRGSPEAAEMLRRRRSALPGAAEEWVLLVRDRALPTLDFGAAPTTPIERHLTRFRSILSDRAEIRRNPKRSWYAVAWPRPELDEPGCIVTPKWSIEPAFDALRPGETPMTDLRVLVPISAEVAAARDDVLRWLRGPELLPWYRHRLKHKGPMTEWYGRPLADIPLPDVLYRIG